MSEITINKENLEKEVYSSDVPVVLKFWAEWCEPCRMLSTEIGQLEKENPMPFKVASLNVDEHPEISSMFKVFCLPTLIFFKNGAISGSLAGYHSKEQIMSCLAQ